MRNTELLTLLECNGLDMEKCEQILCNALRLQCFAQVCDVLRDNETEYLEALRMLRSGIDPALFAARMVHKYCGCRLDEASCRFLVPLFYAFFRKSGTRIQYPDSLRFRLLAEQKGHCALCSQKIDARADLDHIIPWVYVGDELPGNLQLLCKTCNSRKKASPLYPVRVLLTNRAAHRQANACSA